MNLRERIETEFFKGAAVKLDWNVSHNVTDGVLTLGGRAAHLVRETFLLHEMAHFVEIDEARMLKVGWGLVAGEPQLVCGRIVFTPVTTQSTERECRVVAYQVNLYEHFGIKKSVGSALLGFQCMPDFSLIPTRPGTKKERDRRRLRWCAQKVKEFRIKPEYQVEVFKSEWWRKNELLSNSTP